MLTAHVLWTVQDGRRDGAHIRVEFTRIWAIDASASGGRP
jgi:hypothetical protein